MSWTIIWVFFILNVRTWISLGKEGYTISLDGLSLLLVVSLNWRGGVVRFLWHGLICHELQLLVEDAGDRQKVSTSLSLVYAHECFKLTLRNACKDCLDCDDMSNMQVYLWRKVYTLPCSHRPTWNAWEWLQCASTLFLVVGMLLNHLESFFWKLAS